MKSYAEFAPILSEDDDQRDCHKAIGLLAFSRREQGQYGFP
jgi:hypothetical protein